MSSASVTTPASTSSGAACSPAGQFTESECLAQAHVQREPTGAGEVVGRHKSFTRLRYGIECAESRER